MSKQDNKKNPHKKEPINKSKALVQVRIKKLIQNGRVEVTTKEELEKYPVGLSLISYINTRGIFRSGGYLHKFGDNYFIYIVPITGEKYRVRYEFVNKIWVGNVKDLNDDIVHLVSTDKKETDFPVKLGNTILYYAKESYDRKRFCCTNKYQIMEDWFNRYGHLL